MNKRDTIARVAEFHSSFEMEDPLDPTMPPISDKERVDLYELQSRMAQLGRDLRAYAALHKSRPLLRLQLCQEELAELAHALLYEDAVAALDALCDMRYVADGTTLALGMGDIFSSAFHEVHSSNMSKLGKDGRPIKDPAGRVVKPEHYQPPDLEGLMARWDGDSTT